MIKHEEHKHKPAIISASKIMGGEWEHWQVECWCGFVTEKFDNEVKAIAAWDKHAHPIEHKSLPTEQLA